MEQYDTALVLSRVLTSGIVMSIEKNDKELPALERLLTKRRGRSKAVLVNSRTAAVHAALTGQGIGHGDQAVLPAGLDDRTRSFIDWLGVEEAAPTGSDATPAFELLTLTPENAATSHSGPMNPPHPSWWWTSPASASGPPRRCSPTTSRSGGAPSV